MTPVAASRPERREEARDVEPVLALDDAVGEARAGPRRAGGDLGHDRADEREAAGDLQARQGNRAGGGTPQIPEGLEPGEEAPDEGRRPFGTRRAVEVEELEQVAVDRLQAEGGVRQDGEEGHDPRAGEHRDVLVR